MSDLCMQRCDLLFKDLSALHGNTDISQLLKTASKCTGVSPLTVTLIKPRTEFIPYC